MRAFLIAVAGLALASCATTSEDGDMASNNDQPAAPAQEQRAPAATNTASNDDDPSQIICRSERPTGQLRRERICRTRAEWDAIREAGQESMRSRQSTGYQDSPQ